MVSALSFLPHVASTGAAPATDSGSNGGSGGGGGGGGGGAHRGPSPTPSRPQGDLRLLVLPDSGCGRVSAHTLRISADGAFLLPGRQPEARAQPRAHLRAAPT